MEYWICLFEALDKFWVLDIGKAYSGIRTCMKAFQYFILCFNFRLGIRSIMDIQPTK